MKVYSFNATLTISIEVEAASENEAERIIDGVLSAEGAVRVYERVYDGLGDHVDGITQSSTVYFE